MNWNTSVNAKEDIESMLIDAKIAYEVVEEPVYRFSIKLTRASGYKTCDIYPDITAYIKRYEGDGGGLSYLIIWDNKYPDFMPLVSLECHILYEIPEMVDGLHHLQDPKLGLPVKVINALTLHKHIFCIEDTIPLFESGEIYNVRSIGKIGAAALYHALTELGYEVNDYKPISKKEAFTNQSINELAEKLGKPVEEIEAALKETDIVVVKRKKKEVS